MSRPFNIKVEQIRGLCGRIFQVLFSAILLVLFSPLILVSIIAIRIESGAPVFFRQERLGKGMVPFIIYKLRTMYPGVESERSERYHVIDETEHITRVGRILRPTKIDELPQLVNVMKGDMNFVGPRPLRTSLSRNCIGAIPGFGKRYTIKPGLTGICQLMDHEGFDLRKDGLQYELQYIGRKGFILDVLILLLTLSFISKVVLTQIYQKLLLDSVYKIYFLRKGYQETSKDIAPFVAQYRPR